MYVLVTGLIIFFAVHSVSIVSDNWRERMVATLGKQTWLGLYSLATIAGLVLMVWGYGLARTDPIVLYTPPMWLRYIAVLFLIPVFPLLLATFLPGRIQTALRHPALVAIKLWSLAHLLANGMLADVLLFGAFLAWAVAVRVSLKRRTLRPVPGVPASRANDIIAVLFGLALYAGFLFWLHLWLFGVSPLGL